MVGPVSTTLSNECWQSCCCPSICLKAILKMPPILGPRSSAANTIRERDETEDVEIAIPPNGNGNVSGVAGKSGVKPPHSENGFLHQFADRLRNAGKVRDVKSELGGALGISQSKICAQFHN